MILDLNNLYKMLDYHNYFPDYLYYYNEIVGQKQVPAQKLAFSICSILILIVSTVEKKKLSCSRIDFIAKRLGKINIGFLADRAAIKFQMAAPFRSS